nr:terminase small subunit [uncultured Ruminococcus sp.]
MTKKQKRFVEEYLIDLNATQAAIRAGYSPDSAKEIGSENLTKPDIAKAVDQAIAERSRRTGVNADRVVRELAKIAFVNAGEVVDLDTALLMDKISDDDMAAIQSVKVKTFGEDGVEREVKLADKLKALELLGKHLGLFKDKVEINGNVKADMSSLSSILKEIKGEGSAG